MRFLYSVVALLLCSATAFSQHQEIATKPEMWKGKQENTRRNIKESVKYLNQESIRQ